MYSINVQTGPASEPVTGDELAAYLRINTEDEAELLEGFITTARQAFEHLTQRAVIATTFRQYCQSVDQTNQCGCYDFPQVNLMRGPVTSITAVKIRQENGTYSTDTTFTTDLTSRPARIYWASLPAMQTNPPLLYVDFVAGWANAAAVPQNVKTAILLLASSYYENRAAFTTDPLKELPMGFKSICAQYAMSLSGSWGN